jgi:hypothetical protein
MAWAADANHPVFTYPRSAAAWSEDPESAAAAAAGGGGSGAAATAAATARRLVEEVSVDSSAEVLPNNPEHTTAPTADDRGRVEDAGRSSRDLALAALADLALAPWSSTSSSLSFTSTSTSSDISGSSYQQEGGDITQRGGCITQEDIDEALRSDPKACSRATLGSDQKTWWISRPCNSNDDDDDGSGGVKGAFKHGMANEQQQEEADDEKHQQYRQPQQPQRTQQAQQNLSSSSFVSPLEAEEEPWWRVRRRASALEVLLDASNMLQKKGTPLPAGTQVRYFYMVKKNLLIWSANPDDREKESNEMKWNDSPHDYIFKTVCYGGGTFFYTEEIKYKTMSEYILLVVQ